MFICKLFVGLAMSEIGNYMRPTCMVGTVLLHSPPKCVVYLLAVEARHLSACPQDVTNVQRNVSTWETGGGRQ